MGKRNIITRFILIFIAALALCFASVYGARFATQYDLGQLAYTLLIFFPITAAFTGILCGIYLHRIWSAPIISLLAFLAAMLICFGNVNYTYLLVYVLISFAGNVFAYSIKGIRNSKVK